MACYLITGVAGFIGSAVARRLVAEGHSVVGVDNLSTGFSDNVPPEVHFIADDCHNASLYEGVIPEHKYDAIIHVAGQNSGEASFDDPVYDLRSNTESTLLLLRFALKVGCSRFVYGSSMSVYGSQALKEVSEDTFPKPLSCHGVGKLASENYLRLYEQFGIRSTALRLFSVYGPGQNMGNLRQGMVSIFMAMMEEDGHIVIKGSPNRYRDFVYIDDVVEAFVQTLACDFASGKVINVGTGIKTSVGDLVEALRRCSGRGITLEYRGRTPGDIYGIYADITYASRYLQYEPMVELKEGLARMYEWYMGTKQ